MRTKIYLALAAIGIIIGIIFLLVINPFVQVDAGERGVVLVFGAFKGKVMEPGLHIRKPFVEDVVKMDVQTQNGKGDSLAYSSDLQPVTASISINYNVEPSGAGELYQKVGTSFFDRIIFPNAEDTVKQSVANFTAEELVTNRGKLKDMIKVSLRERLSSHRIIVTDFNITNIDFSDQYEVAIEAKQVAEQRAKEQENITKQENEKKKQEILKAEALAEKTRLEATALANQANAENLVKKLEAEAKLEAARKWNGQLPITMVPGGTVPFLNLSF